MDNVVIPGPPQDPNFTVGNGILFGHARGGTARIAHKQVTCENPFADGILVVGGGQAPFPGDNTLIEENTVTMKGSLSGGISLYDEASHNIVRENKVSGNGAYALQVGIFALGPGEGAVGNRFEDNDIEDFNPAVADIFLDTNSLSTVLVDQQGFLIDNGTAQSDDMNSETGIGRQPNPAD